jgi:hypothetical protein
MPTTQGKVRDFLTYALGYGPKLGFRVIPLRPGKKTPLIDDWPNKATWDEAQIREWWRKWPDANIGILTGRYRDGYFIVLDFDPRHGGNWWDDVGEDILPPTWVVHTPNRGRHFYYRTPETFRCEKLPDGLDLRGEGGYVVTPPSLLIDDEKGYIGDWDFQIGNMPKDMPLPIRTQADIANLRRRSSGIWVMAGTDVGDTGEGATEKGGEKANGALPPLWLMTPPIPKGMRHDYLVSFAGALYAAGLTEKEIEAILWAGLELLATLDDFDPVREIEGILKGLQKWEGANYTIGSLLRMLPDPTARVVRRVLTAGVVSGERAIEPVSAPVSAPVSNPAIEPPSEPVGRLSASDSGAESGRVGGEAGGVQADSGADGQASDGRGDGGKADRLALAAELVKKLETRQKEGGGICLVYRKADGTELEAPCTPKGVKALLAQLGVKLTLAETEQVLGVTKKTGEGEAKEKKGRKSKTTDKEDIKAILWRHKWVQWQGEIWRVSKTKKLLRADIDEIHGLLKEEGLDVGKETLRSFFRDIMTDIPKDPLEGIVVTPRPSYGRVGKLRGLWFCHRGDLYLVTPGGRELFHAGEWPEGVYALDLGMQAVLPDWDGTIEDLLIYWTGITPRLKCNPKVALAMYLPVLFGQGHIGLILRGPAKSGKSTLLKGLAYLHLGRKPRTPSGLNKRDLMAVLQRKQIAFFDEVKTFTPELEEALKRMITHDGDEIRALYTNLESVEADLEGSAVFCATNLSQLASDLRTRCFVWDLEPKGGGAQEKQFLTFCQLLWRRALGGAIKLYQLAARVPRPPKNILPEIRFRDWVVDAYRYAVVLDAVKDFLEYVPKSKRAAHKGTNTSFLLDAILHPDFDPRKEYKITELFELAAPVSEETKRLQYSLGRDDLRADLEALALDAGYALRIEKKCASGDKRARYWFIFTPIDTGEDDFLASLLRQAGIKPPSDEDDDEAAPPPETTPPRDTPTPTPTPTPPPTPTPTPPPPPDNTGAGAGVVAAADTGTATAEMAELVQDETKTLTDMEREKKTTPSQLVAGGSAEPNGLTENIHPEDRGICAYITDCIDRYERRGKRMEAIEWVEDYIRKWLDWLTKRGYTASIALLHSELERLKSGGVRQTGNGTPTPAVAASQTAAHPSTSAAPPKTDPKKAPPPSEWVYRAGTTPQNANGGVSDGLFAPPQDAQPTPTPQPPSGGNTENTSQDEEYPTDDEMIAYINRRLREQAEGGITLEGSLDFLNRFLLRFEEEMWQVGLIKSLRYIQNWVIVLQNAIKDLGYDELTPEKDPRLRTPKN